MKKQAIIITLAGCIIITACIAECNYQIQKLKTKEKTMPNGGGTADPQGGAQNVSGTNPNLPIIGGLIDTATNGLAAMLTGKRNRKFAREMYWTQRNGALADWNMQNEYNAPAAQMARLKAAGLNPNLVYGNGGSQVQAATVRSSDMTSGNEQPMHGTTLGENMNQYMNIKLANAQLTAQQLLNEKTRADTAASTATAAKTIGETNLNKFDLDRKNELVLQMIEDAWANTNLKKAQTDTLVHGNAREQELQKGKVSAAYIAEQNARADNAMKQMQNHEFEIMRPVELAKRKAEVEQLLAEIKHTQQETKTEEQETRLRKMEANMGQVLKYIESVVGVVKHK